MAKVKKVDNAVTYKIVGMVSVKNDQCFNNSATAAAGHNEMINVLNVFYCLKTSGS